MRWRRLQKGDQLDPQVRPQLRSVSDAKRKWCRPRKCLNESSKQFLPKTQKEMLQLSVEKRWLGDSSKVGILISGSWVWMWRCRSVCTICESRCEWAGFPRNRFPVSWTTGLWIKRLCSEVWLACKNRLGDTNYNLNMKCLIIWICSYNDRKTFFDDYWWMCDLNWARNRFFLFVILFVI